MACNEYGMTEAQQIRQNVQQTCGSSGDVVATPQINRAVRELGKEKLKSYLKAGLIGALVGAEAGAPFFGIGAIPGAIGGFVAGIGIRSLAVGVDTFEVQMTKFNSETGEGDN